ncbi:MAG: metal ABC transporter solute-binding protein, Zn/Mn family [Acidimicrobiales bacterium]
MRLVPILVLGVALASGCGDDSSDAAADGQAQVVVTHSILGDVVQSVVGDEIDVEVVMPPGVDPHEFAPSSRQVEAMSDADLLVINGAGFEAGLDGAIGAATDAGVELFTFADHIALLDEDPHFWTDPSRMATAVEALATALVGAGVAADHADEYAADLRALDRDLGDALAAIPADRRVLVTNHEVFGYFADRYDFDVLGTVIPANTTQAEPSAADLDDLADTIRQTGVPAIFAETSSSANLADALADSVGDIEVVELFSESLGDDGSGAETYIEMMRTNTERVAEALG